MKDKQIISGQLPVEFLPKKVQKAIFMLADEIEKKKTFAESLKIIDFAKQNSDFTESKTEKNVFFIKGFRISFASDLVVNDNHVRLFRTKEIYKGNSNLPHVKLGSFDVVTASRMILPEDGLLFKLNGFKDKSEYAEIPISIKARRDIVAFEKNLKTGEKCVMIISKTEVLNADETFINKIKTSTNTIFSHFDVRGKNPPKISDWPWLWLFINQWSDRLTEPKNSLTKRIA